MCCSSHVVRSVRPSTDNYKHQCQHVVPRITPPTLLLSSTPLVSCNQSPQGGRRNRGNVLEACKREACYHHPGREQGTAEGRDAERGCDTGDVRHESHFSSLRQGNLRAQRQYRGDILHPEQQRHLPDAINFLCALFSDRFGLNRCACCSAVGVAPSILKCLEPTAVFRLSTCSKPATHR